MRIARCDVEDSVFWAVIDLDEDVLIPIDGAFDEWAPQLHAGAPLDDVLDGSGRLPLAQARLRPPVEPSRHVVCMGLNYRSHVEAFPGADMPSSPVAFIKAQTAIIGHNDEVRYPRLSQALDFELELVAVIARPLEAGDAPTDVVFGYTIGNDVTARDLSKGPRGADLYSAKSLDDTSGVGPWIVTVDEIGSAPDLEMVLRVNGEVRQHDRTSSMEWAVPELVEYVNARTRLRSGDLIFTGTPAGVGHEDGRYLEVGDVMEGEIERVGVLHNRVVEPVGARA